MSSGSSSLTGTWEGAVVIGTLLLVSFYFSRRLASKRKIPFPPGPKGHPLLGNLLQLQTTPWYTFLQWSEVYGPIFYINMCGQNAVVLGTHEAASNLLENRAGIYSDRPKNIVANEILTGGLVFALGPYAEIWRKMRRASHEALNNQISKKYQPLQERESSLLLLQLLEKPSLLENHLKRANSSLLISALYGKAPIQDSLNDLVQNINSIAERVLIAAAPGAFLVEYMPWMMNLPRWMCKWRRDAERDFIEYTSLFMDLLEDVESRLKVGEQTTSVAENIINNPYNGDISRLEKSWLLGTLYAAGSETTSKQMLWFFVSMIVHPEVQKKAQKEIDQVVGRGRLPTFKDVENLSYIRAIVKEVMRWRGVAPLGVPHRSTQDDIYQGYFIPKGTVCIVNAWGLNHDKNVYGEDADLFRPERHLQDEKLKEEGHITYGFGRRICVGKYLANNSMFIQVARILWAFDLHSENPPNPDNFIHDGLILRPELFKCSVTSRFPEVSDIIKDAFEVEFPTTA
ncbi:cytochrome P450 [Cyathus striatus]|nr:cytochrome P450 [Cyathus striatus]